jgi:hypothetical protein
MIRPRRHDGTRPPGLFPSREEESKLAPERAASQMVGDGQLPNRYFVTAATDYYVEGAEGRDWASQHRRDVADRMESQTWGPFETYREARETFDAIDLAEPSARHRQVWTTKIIEDRLSGELAEQTMSEYMRPRYEAEFHEDLKWTKKSMHEAGERFE